MPNFFLVIVKIELNAHQGDLELLYFANKNRLVWPIPPGSGRVLPALRQYEIWV